MEEKKLSTLPIVPDKIIESTFIVFEYGDFPTEEAAEEFVQLLWEKPETAFYYYFPTNGSAEKSLLNYKKSGIIKMAEVERRYYKHSKFKRNYVHIVEGKDGYRWEWERETVEKGPEYWQATITLSARTRSELDTRHKIELEEFYRNSRQKEKYRYDIFLSYSTANSKEAELVCSKASAAGLRVFMAPKDIEPGDDFAEEIRSALEGAVELWLLVSPQSIGSEWVISEWGAAWVLKRKIVPILHRCTPEDIPKRLSRFQCIDFYRIDELISKKTESDKSNSV